MCDHEDHVCDDWKNQQGFELFLTSLKTEMGFSSEQKLPFCSSEFNVHVYMEKSVILQLPCPVLGNYYVLPKLKRPSISTGKARLNNQFYLISAEPNGESKSLKKPGADLKQDKWVSRNSQQGFICITTVSCFRDITYLEASIIIHNFKKMKNEKKSGSFMLNTNCGHIPNVRWFFFKAERASKED